MSQYTDLDDLFQEQLRRTGRFVRAAFHVHSIDSHDWGKDGDTDLNAVAHFEGPQGQARFLDALAGAGLELVCITDHMKAGYACELAELAAQRDDITVLPGMEISCKVPPGHGEAIHVLVVFPPTATPDVIDRLFAGQHGLPGAAERTGHEQVVFDSLEEVRNHIDHAGGLFILAHIDQQPRGHRCYVRSVRGETAQMFAIDASGKDSVQAISREYAEHLVALNPHAVEVMKSQDRAHYYDFMTADGSQHRYPGVARSDHHSLEVLTTGDAITYVKVSRRGIDCLRDALVFHETRVRFADDLPVSPSPRIVGLRLRGGGLFSDGVIALNENLNCLIGPRGCGKSTIIEALRYVLGQRPLLDDPAAPGEDDRSYAGLALATQRANLQDTEIELIYERDDTRHVLTATYDSAQPIATRVFTLDGEDCRVTHEALEAAYPARIFSWSELETLGRQPRLQRLVIDRLAETLPDLQGEESRLREALRTNRARVNEHSNTLAGLLSEEQGALRRWAEYKIAYEQLNTPEVQGLFSDLDRARERIDTLTSLDQHLAAITEDASALAERDPTVLAASVIEPRSVELRQWWTNEMDLALDLPGLKTTIANRAGSITTEVDRRRATLASRIVAEQSEADNHEAALREQTHASPGASVQRDQREQARQRFEAAVALRERYQATFAELEDLLAKRGQLLESLDTATQSIGDARIAIAEDLGQRLAEIGQHGPRITISVNPGQDRAAFTRHLDQNFLNVERGGQYRARGLPGRLCLTPPTELVYAILANRPGDLVSEAGLTGDEGTRLVAAFDVFCANDDSGVTGVSPALDELLELQEQPVDDLVLIESDGQPVHKLSPGGRSSVMLPLIALSDDVPLIIDQPEDNLDNRMVGQTLSSILSRLKERRQIIVTTHNPNIVVGGDAEQVVVLDAPTARSARIERTGDIDDPEIIDAVIKIMEGGREAFEERSRRYRNQLQ